MGNHVSSSASLAPISEVSVIIGFISFSLTLATALRVFWQNLRTLASANSEVRDFLPNLKQALHEERSHLRIVRRRCKAQYDEAAFRVLADSIRHMISQFKDLEEPFVHDPKPPRGEKRRHARHGSGKANGKRDRDYALEAGPEDFSDDYYLLDFRATSLHQRIAWLKRRNSFRSLGDRLARVQGRRIARQQTDLAIDTKYLAGVIGDLQDRVEDMEQRLLRSTGARRGD